MHDLPNLRPNDEQVLRVLQGESRPLSAYDILARLEAPKVKAPVQIYRSLHKLMRAGRVHRVESANGYVACGRCACDGQPGFLICKACGRVKEFEIDDSAPYQAAIDAAGFTPQTISVEVFGLCRMCRSEEAVA
jgi:Fur family zinc uptake transcriptional regulator